MFTCYQCKGRKIFSALGFMEVKCLHCDGTGQTQFDKWPKISDLTSQTNELQDVEKPKRKRRKNRKLKQLIIPTHPLTLIKDKLMSVNTLSIQNIVSNDGQSVMEDECGVI